MLVQYFIHILVLLLTCFCSLFGIGFDFLCAPCFNNFLFVFPDGEAEDTEFYTLVAQKLDYFVKHQQRISPIAAKSSVSPKDPNITISTDTISANSGTTFIFLCV